MKKTTWLAMSVIPALLLAATACSSNENSSRVVVKEPGKTITVIDEGGKEQGEPDIAVEKIEKHEQMEITDWLDEDRVIVSKANEALGKMRLEELADSYPRSLYVYNLRTKQLEPLKEQENVYLGGAVLSPDKKQLLYSEFTLGDPAYFWMDLATGETVKLSGEGVAGALSAKWADDGTIVGPSYSGGAFTASVDGSIAPISGLSGDSPLVIVEKIKNKLYYTSNSDSTLTVLDLSTGETSSLKLNDVYSLAPSPDGKQMVALQYNGPTSALLLSDANGDNLKKLAEGAELGGMSWSPDQRMIAYTLKADANGSTLKDLYVFDLLTGKSTKLALDTKNAATSWSPSGQELVYTEWDGKQYNSTVVSLTFSMP